MSIHIYVAPAASGKTSYVLRRARDVAAGLVQVARICVASHLQARSCRARLAQDGGAIGVQVMTFDMLYSQCLAAAGRVYTSLSEPVEYRLLRAVVDDLCARQPGAHFAPLRDRPGFIHLLQRLIAELEEGHILPADFAAAVQSLPGRTDLAELGQIYSGYQARLANRAWADRAGLAWLALEAVEESGDRLGWPLLLVDGYADFTVTQLHLLRALGRHIDELIVTINGDLDHPRPIIDAGYTRARQALEDALAVPAEPLPTADRRHEPPLAHLVDHLYEASAPRTPAQGCLDLLEAPDQAGEVRAALRWLKQRCVAGVAPRELALLARNVQPYRAHIVQTAAELGLPIRLACGLPLRSNPCISALLGLLQIALPAEQRSGLALPYRPLVETWRSPYFNWRDAVSREGGPRIGIEAGDADALDAAARWGRVIAGYDQWQAVLTMLAQRPPGAGDNSDDECGMAPGVPVGEAAAALLAKLQRFMQRIAPPTHGHYSDFVAWLENMIGGDPTPHSREQEPAEEPMSLRVVQRARGQDGAAPAELPALPLGPLAALDIAALQALKDVLRGLVWAVDAVEPGKRVSYTEFYSDLAGALEAASYRTPLSPQQDEILVADVDQAGSLPMYAVAVVGLAEGEFPAALVEDHLLPDDDRAALRGLGLPLRPSLESAERRYLYETVACGRARLLFTRPRLADNGALWQASPHWEEVQRLLDATPRRVDRLSLDEAASWPELMELSASEPDAGLCAWLDTADPQRWQRLGAAADLVSARSRRPAAGACHPDGDLSAYAHELQTRFGPQRRWSASRLESYRACPFSFFVGSVLGMEPRPEVSEGLDARQLGNLYHHILADLYRGDDGAAHTSLDDVLAVFERVVDKHLDEAPRREGFRATAWWQHTRAEIRANLLRTVTELDKQSTDYRPARFEIEFDTGPAVILEGEPLRLHGFIDRVDQDSLGRLRIVDYKTGGPWGFDRDKLHKGLKLQLQLYAIGAQVALGLGVPSDGFYWHVQQGEASKVTLANCDGNPQTTIRRALEHCLASVRAIRRGEFAPQRPEDGCESYCPAAGFCWYYHPRWGG